MMHTNCINCCQDEEREGKMFATCKTNKQYVVAGLTAQCECVFHEG